MDNIIINKGNYTYQVDIEKIIESPNDSLSFLMDKNREIYYEDFVTESQAIVWRKSQIREDIRKESFQPINEATYKELLSMAERKRVKRASLMSTKYLGVTSSRGWIKFTTESQRIKGKYYTQYIKLAEANDIKYFKEFNVRQITRLFISGDIQVSCTCPDMRYRYRYMAYNLGYGIQKETRFPKIRNPQLEGSVCKHLIVVLKVIQMNWSKIARDMGKSKFFRKKMDDVEYFRELDRKRALSKKKKKAS